MGETVEEIQQPVSPTMAGQSDSEESTESTLGLGPGLSGMDLSGDAEGRGGDPRTARRVGSGGESQESTEGEFSCRWGTCHESFSHVDLLASHVTCIHATSGEGGLFFCGWRGCSRGKRGFNARYKMLIHVRTHTNEKPHRCPRCDKSFSRAENLKIHARSHTGERPYVCPVPGCGKAYSNSSDRFKHTRTHSVERPYACRVPGCSKRYTDPSSLRKHVKTYAHYHRPGTENNSKVEEQNSNETNLIEQVQDKKLPTSRINGKVNDTGKNKFGNTLLNEETRRSSRNSRTQALKDVKMNSTAKVSMDYQENRLLPTKDELREAAIETDPNKERLLQKEFGSRNNKLSEHGRIQPQHIEDCSPTSWDTIPDDKWLENDIEEVEEDEEEEMNREDFQNQEQLGMKETSYLSGDVIHDQSRHSKMVLDAEWSSGGEEGWMSDESDYMQNGIHVTSLSTAYVDFSNKTVKSSHRPYYLAEQQMISKLNKKNYILSRSCQKKLDDLLLRSLPKFGSSNQVGAKKHHYHTDAFQDHSSSTIDHQSRVVYKGLGKYKKVFTDMAYNEIPYEQVVPLDLRKINE